MDCIRDGAGRTQFRMQSVLGLNWTPWDDLVSLSGPTARPHVPVRTHSPTNRATPTSSVESRKEPDRIVVGRRRDDAGTGGGRCPERWAQEGSRRRRFGWARQQNLPAASSTGGCAVGGRPTNSSAAPRRCRHAPARQPAATCRAPWIGRRVRVRWQVRRSGCSRSVQRCGVSIGPDGAAPAGTTTAPAVALPTRAMPAPPSEARCVRSNSIRARW